MKKNFLICSAKCTVNVQAHWKIWTAMNFAH
jgi:hypothetical protein